MAARQRKQFSTLSPLTRVIVFELIDETARRMRYNGELPHKAMQIAVDCAFNASRWHIEKIDAVRAALLRHGPPAKRPYPITNVSKKGTP